MNSRPKKQKQKQVNKTGLFILFILYIDPIDFVQILVKMRFCVVKKNKLFVLLDRDY